MTETATGPLGRVRTPRWRGTRCGSVTTRWCSRSSCAGGSPGRQPSRRIWRSPTSRSTWSAMPGPCWPSAGAWTAPAVPRTTSRSCARNGVHQRAARRDPGRRLRRDGGTAARLHPPRRAPVRGPGREYGPGAGGVRRPGGQGGRLPPAARRRLGRPAGPGHRGERAADAGGAGAGVAVHGRTLRGGRAGARAHRGRCRARTGPLRERWHEEVAAVLERAGLPLPAPTWHAAGGRDGLHTEAFGPLVAELQSVHRQFPGGTW